MLTLDDIACDLDVLLTGHEDEHVANASSHVHRQDLFHGSIHIILARRLGEEGIDRKGASRDRKVRCVAIELRKLSEHDALKSAQGVYHLFFTRARSPCPHSS